VTATSLHGIVIRQATSEDIPTCADICFRAFSAINKAHNFPSDIPAPEAAFGIISACFTAPDFYCVVAEVDGRILGSNCLDTRSVIHGVGPITVDPATQNQGVGRRLMDAALEYARQQGAAGVRLVQAAFHSRSLSLYASLGFDVREPIAVMQGRSRARNISGCAVRHATAADLAACNELSHRVHGFDRATDLRQCVERGGALVAEHEGRITAYASQLAFFGHATAESNSGLKALIASVDSFGGAGILVPIRNAELFRWCLANGLRVVEPMTLMSMGLYNEPAGAFLSSILF
jgi:predicted N-acetyltransferase YhbS